MQATLQALADFRNGILRVYTMPAEQESPKFTGTHDGPFEVWVLQYYPSLGAAHQYATEHYMKAYNSKMRYVRSS